MATGYPDFTRLSSAGGWQLYAGTGTFGSGQVLFAGYVGSWPYVDVITQSGPGTYYYALDLQWSATSTFSDANVTQNVIRSTDRTASVQLATIAPWLEVTMETYSVTQVIVNGISLWGTYGHATSARLYGSSGPMVALSQDVAGTETVTTAVPIILPGPAVLSCRTASASWSVQIQRFDYNTGLWVNWFRVDNTVAIHGGTWPVPVPDAPCQLVTINNSTSYEQFDVTWMSAGA